MPRRARSSEVDAYVYIKGELKDAGWDTRNPARHPEGRVYTQSEALAHPELAKGLGLDRPENVVKVTESIFWVIEAKREHRELSKALREAVGYATAINEKCAAQALFVSGVAGNDSDSFLIQTRFWNGLSFVPIEMNGRAITGFLSPELARFVLENGPSIQDVPIDEALFLSKAERINEILHLGAINKNYRARVMAALLLSLAGDSIPDVDAPPLLLVRDINSRVEFLLNQHNKPEFVDYIKITLPATTDNHVKFKDALVKTIQELQNLNIRSAMNSGADVLGKFYEVFLKYGNGAKEIGIVLTPRHITRFAVEVLGVTSHDIVFDPTCGTGGFLVASLDHVRRSSNESQITRFQEHNLFGVEQEPEVVALAIVNMIFRGDGKNNIVEGNCFRKHLQRVVRQEAVSAEYSNDAPDEADLAVTRVLMNPPFALKASDDKEFRFVDYALRQMEDGGLLFSVLPYSALVKPEAYRSWRRHSLLAKHTLLSVITFPEDLFYPVHVHSVGIFVRKGVPHPVEQRVLWIRAVNDGMIKSKGKRLPSSRALDDYPQIKSIISAFIGDPESVVHDIDKLQRACPIDFDDPLLELVPENYLGEPQPNVEEMMFGMEQVIRETMAFQIRGRWG
jgi:type I restriction enzyme M protein